jgi:teichuronic acid biosynthesis glycosyltransferase TuaC
VRALVVTNMYPSPERPAFGRFVQDQVEALRRVPGLEVEVFAFAPGLRSYPRAARELRRSFGAGERFDVVHAHFGLTAWPARVLRAAPLVVTLHGTDVHHPRSGRLTRAALHVVTLAAAVSAELARELPGAGRNRRVAVLPAGIDLGRFAPRDRREARRALGLDPEEPFLLFPADPARPEKRHDRALATAAGARVHALGGEPPERVPLWVNAANAVVVPSDREGFGLAVLEALACDVPVLATPVGIHPVALRGLDGALCAPWDEERWRGAARALLEDADPRVDGRPRARLFGADRMAARVAAAWQDVVAERAGGRG